MPDGKWTRASRRARGRLFVGILYRVRHILARGSCDSEIARRIVSAVQIGCGLEVPLFWLCDAHNRAGLGVEQSADSFRGGARPDAALSGMPQSS